MKVYISGPISGIEREVYMRRFAEGEERLRRLLGDGAAENGKLEVVNPTKFAVCRWPWLYKLMGYSLTLIYDLWRLKRCDAIYLLHGWEQSQGAVIEKLNAEHSHKLVLYAGMQDKTIRRRVKGNRVNG